MVAVDLWGHLGRRVTPMLAVYAIATVVVTVATGTQCYAWPCIAFPLLQMKHLCVFCDILAPKASLQTDWFGCASGR